MAKVVSRMVWSFRAWRKSFPEWFVISAHGESYFPEWFGISAHGESYFPNGLVFPRMAKVVSRIFLHLRGSRNSLFKGFDATL